MSPSHWPADVQYILEPYYHHSVPKAMQSYLKGNSALVTPPPRDQKSPPCMVIIRRIQSPTHPACGQHGLFAAKKIPPHTYLLDYIGEVHCEDRVSDYDLSLYRSHDGVNVGMDAQVMGNEARFVNDFRGICSKPNAFFVDRRTDSGELRVSIRSSKEEIKKGSEILVSYGKSWWSSRNLKTSLGETTAER